MTDYEIALEKLSTWYNQEVAKLDLQYSQLKLQLIEKYLEDSND